MADIKLSSGYCEVCDQEVLAVAEAPSHPVWFSYRRHYRYRLLHLVVSRKPGTDMVLYSLRR